PRGRRSAGARPALDGTRLPAPLMKRRIKESSMSTPTLLDPRRRHLLGALGAGTLAPWATLSLAAAGAAGPNRFVFVILRGGLDGLSSVPAVGDADFASALG